MSAHGFIDSLFNRPKDKLPVSTYFGYGIGQVGGQILRDTPALILPIYMSTVLGLEAALGGLVILIAKVWVVFADPMAGIISDRTDTKWGRRRPFILVGGLLAAFCFIFLFFVPDLESQLALFFYMTAFYVILNTGYSGFSVPYLTMASEMSEDADERTTILGFRNAFLAIGLIVAGALSPKIIAYVTQDLGGTPREGYEYMGLVLGAIIVVATVWVFVGTAKVPRVESSETTTPLKEQIKIALENKPFVILMMANIVQYISAGLGYAGAFFFLAYSVGLSYEVFNVVPLWIVLMSVTSILGMPTFVWAAAKFGKMFVYKGCLIMFSLTTPVYFFADVSLPLEYVSILGVNIPLGLWPVWVASICIGYFNSGFILMSFSVLTDTIVYDRAVSGLSREGALSSVYSAVEKVSNALGSVIFMFFLSLVGFIATDDGSFAAQSESTLDNIMYFYILAPAFLHSASILILNKYDLTKEKLDSLAASPSAAE